MVERSSEVREAQLQSRKALASTPWPTTSVDRAGVCGLLTTYNRDSGPENADAPRMGRIFLSMMRRYWSHTLVGTVVAVGWLCLAADQKRPPVPAVPDDYRIGAGDVLGVLVWREPDASVPEVAVRVDGKITMPLVGDVAAAGLVPTELQASLTEKLSRYINQPVVSVVVKEINSRRIYVTGGVRKEGPISLIRPMTVLQAINEAGGFSEWAKKSKIYVLRKADGKQVKLRFDYKAFLRGKNLEQNIVLMPDDTVVVPD